MGTHTAKSTNTNSSARLLDTVRTNETGSASIKFAREEGKFAICILERFFPLLSFPAYLILELRPSSSCGCCRRSGLVVPGRGQDGDAQVAVVAEERGPAELGSHGEDEFRSMCRSFVRLRV